MSILSEAISDHLDSLTSFVLGSRTAEALSGGGLCFMSGANVEVAGSVDVHVTQPKRTIFLVDDSAHRPPLPDGLSESFIQLQTVKSDRSQPSFDAVCTCIIMIVFIGYGFSGLSLADYDPAGLTTSSTCACSSAALASA